MSARKKRSPVRRGERASAGAIARTDDAVIASLAIDLGAMIEAARQQVAIAANAALTTLYWQVGHRVRTEVPLRSGARRLRPRPPREHADRSARGRAR